jgi:hypothetical protein
MATPIPNSAAVQNLTRFLLPNEDPAEFAALLAAFRSEHQPGGPTEAFLVEDLARCQWKLRRISAIEAALLSDPASSSLADIFRNDSTEKALAKLGRHETRIRRDWYRALNELRALRREETRARGADARCQQAEADARFNQLLEAVDAPIAFPRPEPPAPAPSCQTKPMPAHLERELAAHRRRDPLFDPRMDASQMSKELRKWFQTLGSAVA